MPAMTRRVPAPVQAPGELAEVFQVLSDPTRIQIVRMLASDGEVACTTLESRFAFAKSTISYHVKALRTVGLIRVRKDGKYYHYQLLTDEMERRLPGLLRLITESSPD